MPFSTYRQNSFKLGLNRLDEPTDLMSGEYALLANGRVRYGGVQPINLPKQITNLPTGKLQGVYSADKYLLVFVDGQAYYRDMASESNFFTIEDFQLDATVDQLYAAIVPASTMNYARIPTVEDSEVITNDRIQLTSAIGETPSCVVVQDGINQPFIIFPNGTARRAQTYNEWESDAIREYVPIGRQMFYHSGIGVLFVVGQDSAGNYTDIYRSVTGRPLDFMVNIDADGDKLEQESEGGAHSTAYRVDFGDITCIAGVSAADNGFYVSTNKTSYLVTPDFDHTVFGEPSFTNQVMFSTGALNNNSIVDLLGDSALIDFTGIRSFNGILQTRVEGRNSPFSAKVQRILGDRVQDITAAAEFDNYGFFACDTVYGPAILVYDTILNARTSENIQAGAWVSIDTYLESKVRQFASVKTIYKRALFYITEDNKLWEYNASGVTANCSVYVGEWSAGVLENGSQAKSQKPHALNLIFVDVLESGTIYADCYLDGFRETSIQGNIEQANVTSSNQSLPFGINSNDTVRNKTLNFETVSLGWKTGFWISWNFSAKLQNVNYTCYLHDSLNSVKSVAEDFKSLNETLS